VRPSRQRRREDEEAVPPAAHTAAAPDTTSEVLALQQSAGNHAVTRALATARLDRDTGAPAKPQPPPQKEEPKKGAVYKMDVKDVGVFDLLSFQFGQPPRRRRDGDDRGSGGGGGTKLGPAEMTVTMVTSKGSVKLVDAAANGKRLEQVVIEVTGSEGRTMTITLKGVFVTSYVSGGSGGERVESFGLSSDETEIKHSPSAEPGGAETEGWTIP
jgi:type VI protein secretion system component Hcp